MQGNNWSLYVSGTGAYDQAESMLTNLVGRLRDAGLKIDTVEVLQGELHPDAMQNAPSGAGQDGWTLNAYGTGDITTAYELFPGFLNEFKQAGIDVVANGIVTGERREITV
jgi:GH35 family endo-1,4-beta-xylanase